MINDFLINVRDHVFENVEFYFRDSGVTDPQDKAKKVGECILYIYEGIVRGADEFENDFYNYNNEPFD